MDTLEFHAGMDRSTWNVGHVIQVDRKELLVINPLTGLVSHEGKERPILDLRYVNKHIYRQKVKFLLFHKVRS